MSSRTSSRVALVARHDVAMRDFNAHAVLLQDFIAKSAGLNGADLQVVGLLMSNGPATPGELAELTGLSAGGAITALVDRLESAGYVVRHRDGRDRRRVLVEAVPEVVLASVGTIYQRIGEQWNSFLATLSDDQLLIVTEVIEAATTLNRSEIAHLRQTRGLPPREIETQ